MDILSDMIRMADIDGRLFDRQVYDGEWEMPFPCDKSAGFHVVLQGACWLRGPDLDAPVRLERGDVVLMARGVPHTLASAGGATTTFVGAAYQFRDETTHPMFDGLPPLLHMAGAALAMHHPIHAAVGLLSAELADGRPGAQTVVERLMDVIFHYIVRAWVESDGAWGEALRDPALSKALVAMHREVGRDWDVVDLAAEAGLSRSAFAERFKRTTGESPAKYLARLRVQRAMALLRGSERGLESIAAEVGYANAFALSKAFKREVGQAPGTYRKQAS